MPTTYKMQEATFNLPSSDYVDTTVNIFKYNNMNDHSFIVTRIKRDSNLSLEQEIKNELNENINKITQVGGKIINISAIQMRTVKSQDNYENPALLAEYSFEMQGKKHYLQQLVTEITRNVREKKIMLVFTYTQFTPISEDDLDQLLNVWDSIRLTD